MSTNRAEIIALVASYNAVRAPDASEARVIYDAEGRVDGVAAFGRVLDCLTAAERLRVIVARAGTPAAAFLAAAVSWAIRSPPLRLCSIGRSINASISSSVIALSALWQGAVRRFRLGGIALV
jgi:hypothetical protein